MNYVVFARKWRPQNFDEIIGQPHIVRTLKNAIDFKRIAHAYLFTGPRGIGKTSTARILAKALNCEKGPTKTPCANCASCKEISKGISLDVLEIDGASNRGIDEIRALRENVKFAPVHGKFKIYIIDEVHQITPDGFNALLKTLEEPPAHVKFIFATTQPHKVLATILSRCQRFDFRRIPIKDIISKLNLIVKKEKIDVADDAIHAIAKAADGSMRDAESILDQVVASGKGKVKFDDIVNTLGIIRSEILFDLTDKLAKKDTVSVLKMIGKVVDEGKDPVQFMLSLVKHFRNLMVSKLSQNLEELVDLNRAGWEALGKQSQLFSMEELLYGFYLLSHTANIMRRTDSPRITLELALVKIALRDNIASLGEIIKRLDDFETKLGSNIETEPERIQPQVSIDSPKAGPITTSREPRTAIQPPKPQENTELKNRNSQSQIEIGKIFEIWHELLSQLKHKKISIATYLLESEPHSVEKGTLTIGLAKEFNFHKEVLEKPENRKLIEQSLKKLLSVDIRVAFATVESAEKSTRLEPSVKSVQDEPVTKTASGESIIHDAEEIFDGRIIRNTPVKKGKPSGEAA